MLIFKKDFLDELEEKSRYLDAVEIVMQFCNVSFDEAILKIAKFHEIEPRYVERKKIAEKCKAALHEE